MYSRESLLQKLCMHLNNLTQVKSCTLHGSLASGQYDEYSDIDLRLDVSGIDNGKFMLTLPKLLSKEFDIGYVAYAPKFIPSLYLITLYFNNTSIFHFVDIECLATPHITTISKEELISFPEHQNVLLKLTLNSLKRYLRTFEFDEDVHRIYSFLVTDKKDKDCSSREKIDFILDYFSKSKHKAISEVALTAKTFL